MVGWNERQRCVLIDKLPDTANLALAGLLFGQAASDRGFSLSLASAGVAMWAAFMAGSVILARKDRQ